MEISKHIYWQGTITVNQQKSIISSFSTIRNYFWGQTSKVKYPTDYIKMYVLFAILLKNHGFCLTSLLTWQDCSLNRKQIHVNTRSGEQSFWDKWAFLRFGAQIGRTNLYFCTLALNVVILVYF